MSKIVLVPTYLKEFKCNGQICEDSCCIGLWNITIDKKHFKMLKNVRKSQIGKNINKFIKINKESISPMEYGRILQDDNTKRCAFLTEDRLCDIQLKLGEEYLGDVCLSYPRVTNIIDENYERALSASCPLATEKILFNDEGIKFEELEEKIDRTYRFNFNIKPSSNIYEKSLNKYLNEIRTFSIQITKSRDYELWERLIILGMMCDKLQELQNNDEIDKVPELLISYTNYIISGEFKKYLAGFEFSDKSSSIQVEMLKEIVDERMGFGYVNQRYRECIEDTLKGLDYSYDIKKVTDNYKQAYHKFYKPYFKTSEYILENYLVNYMFSHLFPYSIENDFFGEYIKVVLHYSIIKLHLIGTAAYYKEEFNNSHILKIMQSFSKEIEHSPNFQRYIYDLIKKNNYNTLPFMMILVGEYNPK